MNKKLFVIFITACIFSVFCSPAYAEKKKNDNKMTLAGAIASFIVHEGGHKFAGKGGEMEWTGSLLNPKWEYNGSKDEYELVTDKKTGVVYKKYYDESKYKTDLQRVAMAGITVQDETSHYINLKLDKDKSKKAPRWMWRAGRGFVAFNLFSNVQYLTVDKNKGDMDPANFSSEKSRQRFKNFVWVDTGILGYEYFTKKSILPKGTSISYKNQTVLLKWTTKFYTSREKRDKK
jgi:hypothetical protein